MTDVRRHAAAIAMLAAIGGCAGSQPPPPPSQARHLLLVTIDTIRADRVGAYGDASARTPAIDALAQRGLRFERAYATAPITLPSHASIMTGRYPAGHGARHNGMRVDGKVPTLAATLAGAGFATAAFVGAFPLDRRFGLEQGFATYDDRMPRGTTGKLANERPGRIVVDEAIAWIGRHRTQRMFVWVHLFEPHAPYGNPGDGRPVDQRYRDEIAEADAQIGRLLSALGQDAPQTAIVVAGDHGEAFGEHDEVSHSLFVYDTTLRVPFVIAAPSLAARVVSSPVSLVDLAPTVMRLLGVSRFDADGIDLTTRDADADRELYAESYAPLLDFGWSPLRTVRAGGLKYIAAPREELYDVEKDPAETNDIAKSSTASAATLRGRVSRYGADAMTVGSADPDARARLQALGYVGSGTTTATRADPKDRRALARLLAEVMSGELQGPALESALNNILKQDAGNAQAHVRLGHLLVESNRCADAVKHLEAAIDAGLPGADPHIDLAFCHVQARRLAQASDTLRAGARAEPGNPVVLANLGMVLSDAGRHAEGAAPLQRALEIDPDFHQARFNLARVLARDGRQEQARRQAEELLSRLPRDAPQKSEVERLIAALK